MRCGLSFFPMIHSGERLKNIRIRCRIRRMHGTEALSGKKKLEIQKYPDTCGAILFKKINIPAMIDPANKLIS